MIRSRWTGRAAIVAMWGLLYLGPLLSGRTLPARDVAATQIPWRTVWVSQIEHGQLPIWDPLSNQGRLLLANPNSMSAYPGTTLFLLMGPESAAAWHLALHHLLLLLGLEFLAARAGFSPGASLVAATALGTSGLAFSQLTFMNAQASLAWAPWALATALPRTAHRPGASAQDSPLLAGGLLGLSFLGGEPVVAALAALAWTVVTLSAPDRRRLRRVGWAAAAALLVAAPVLVPLAFNFDGTYRGALGVRSGALGADTLAPRRFLELLFPNLLGAPLGDGGNGFWAYASFGWQRYEPLIFPGSLVLIALACAASSARQMRVWWALVLAGVGTSVTLAVPPVAAAAAHAPVLGAARFGIKFLLLGMLCATPLVAAGWESLAGTWGRLRRRLSWATLAGLALALIPALAPGAVLAPVLEALYPASRTDLQGVPPARLGIALAGDAACLAAPLATVALAGVAPLPVVLVTFAANAVAARGVLRFGRASSWAEPPELVTAVRHHGPVAAFAAAAPVAATEIPADLTRFWRARAAAVPSYATRWGLGYVLAKGPDGLEPVREELLAEACDRAPVDDCVRLAEALGAGAVVLPEQATASGTSTVAGLPVRVMSAPPQFAYLARRLLPAEGMVATLNTLVGVSFRPTCDAVVGGQAAAASLDGGIVSERPGVPHAMRFRTSSPGSGLLVVRQSYMRCWRATVDGSAVAVEAVNGCQLGVRLPPGDHEVTLAIDLLPYRIGFAAPVLFLLLAAAAHWRRSPGPAHPTPGGRHQDPVADREPPTGGVSAGPPGQANDHGLGAHDKDGEREIDALPRHGPGGAGS